MADTKRILFLLSRVNNPILRVKRLVISWLGTASLGFINLRNDGKKIKEITNAHTIPIVMIQPKSITGRIPLTIRERNATIVVIAV